jgi:hypothetical protein
MGMKMMAMRTVDHVPPNAGDLESFARDDRG